MNRFRNEFRIGSDFFYLNSGTHSIVPTTVLQAIQQYQIQFEKNPTQGLVFAWGHLWESQKAVAEFVGANPKDIFLRNNVTEALNEFILQLPMPTGTEILVTNQEYGAVVNICRRRCLKDQLTLREFSLPNRSEIKNVKSSDIVNLLISAIGPKTKMIVLSEVISSSGLILPIKEIAVETNKRGIILVVDGAHSPGAFKLDLINYQNVDAYAGNLHKWFMGPKGTAFGWLHHKHKNNISALFCGWSSFEVLESFADFAEGDSFAVRMLMVGCRDFSNFFALKDAVIFWKKIGESEIFDQLKDIGGYLSRQADLTLDLPRYASDDSELQGPLYPYLLPEKFQNTSSQSLMSEILSKAKTQVNITVIDNEKYLRLSPHIYNTTDEIDEALGLLKKNLKN